MSQQDKQQVLEIVRAIEGENTYQRVKSAVDANMTPDQIRQGRHLFNGPRRGGLTAEAKRRAEEAGSNKDQFAGESGLAGDASQRAEVQDEQ